NVIAAGPAYENTVTIDAGSADGLKPDETVLNGAGLVGRVTSVSSHTATVLLDTDAASTVGVRIAGTGKIGAVTGLGHSQDGPAALRLQVFDANAVLAPGMQLVTFGSVGGRPYVPGVPVGVITRVVASPSALTKIAYVRPFADDGALGVVGVVIVPPRRNPRDSVLPRPPRPAPSPSPSGTGATPSPGTSATPAAGATPAGGERAAPPGGRRGHPGRGAAPGDRAEQRAVPRRLRAGPGPGGRGDVGAGQRAPRRRAHRFRRRARPRHRAAREQPARAERAGVLPGRLRVRPASGHAGAVRLAAGSRGGAGRRGWRGALCPGRGDLRGPRRQLAGGAPGAPRGGVLRPAAQPIRAVRGGPARRVRPLGS